MKRIFTMSNARGKSRQHLKRIIWPFLFLLIGVTSLHAQALVQADFKSVLTPLYMSSGTSTRLPVVYRATLTNLAANTTFRFNTQASVTTDLGGSAIGAGNPLLINPAGTAYKYTAATTFTSADNYETFTTDANGSYTGWFGIVNTGNAGKFSEGVVIFPSIAIADNVTGVVVARRALDASVTVLAYATTGVTGTSKGSFLKGTSSGATAKNLVAIYDNTAGTGRPLYITPVEQILEIPIASTVPGYSTADGSWNAIIPNINANGVQRIEQRSVTTGAIVGCATDNDGIWATGSVNTKNPTAGVAGLTITGTDAQLVSCGTTVSLSASANAGTETDQTVITLTATLSAPAVGQQLISLAVSGTNITSTDYLLSSTLITIADGSTNGTVTFTILDDADIETLETAVITISGISPGIFLGSPISQSIAITDSDTPPNLNAPVIMADNETVIDPETVTASITIPDNSPVSAPAAFITAIINNANDPAKTIGIEFNVSDIETPAVSLLVTATSSNAAVVTNANLLVTTGNNNSRNLKITPTGLGNSDITVTVNDGSLTSSYVIKYTATATPTLIHDIQGSGTSAALTGNYIIEGIVTRTFIGTTGLSGFYVQEEDADADTDPATSEGIFVYNLAADPAGLLSVNQGDKIQIAGTVINFVSTVSGFTTNQTELTTITSMNKLATEVSLPNIVNVTLPVANVTDLERYEGMLVNLSASTGSLTVTEFFQLGRYGQVVLSVDGPGNISGTDARLDQYTQYFVPGVAAYNAYLADIAKRKIYLDDGSTTQNPDPVIFGRGGNPLSATNTLRGGDQVSSIIGILDERLEGYRIQTTSGVNFVAVNNRPTSPPDLGSSATLKVASANVLNYFNGNGSGLDGSAGGFPTSRGANNLAEFNRQRNKIIEALFSSQADVIGLMEIERDDFSATSAIQDLVNGLNTRAGVSGTYNFINSGIIATDVITVGIIYKPGKVTPDGASASMPDGYGQSSPGYPTGKTAFDVVGRKPLAQTFIQNSNSEKFTVVVNHFKSKGSSSDGAGDADTGDGQGFSNGTRVRQAQDLAAWLATNPTGTIDKDYLILGDLNAYAKEDPITALATAGYSTVLPATSYSYVFDGFAGSLDHALASASLAGQVTGAEKYHINADEPSVLDYNTEFKTSGQVTSLYATDRYRASDHDPVMVGLNLAPALPVKLISFNGKYVHSADQNKVVLNWVTSEELQNEGFEVWKGTNTNTFEKIGFVSGNATTSQRSVYEFADANVKDGQLYYYRLNQKDFDGKSEMSRIIAVRTTSELASETFIYPNPSQGKFILSAENATISDIKLYNNHGIEIPVSVQKMTEAGLFSVQPKLQLPAGSYNLQIKKADSKTKNGQALKVIVQ